MKDEPSWRGLPKMWGAQQLESPERLVEGEGWQPGPDRPSLRNIGDRAAWRHALRSRRRSKNPAQRVISMVMVASIVAWASLCTGMFRGGWPWPNLLGSVGIAAVALVAMVIFEDSGPTRPSDPDRPNDAVGHSRWPSY